MKKKILLPLIMAPALLIGVTANIQSTHIERPAQIKRAPDKLNPSSAVRLESTYDVSQILSYAEGDHSIVNIDVSKLTSPVSQNGWRLTYFKLDINEIDSWFIGNYDTSDITVYDIGFNKITSNYSSAEMYHEFYVASKDGLSGINSMIPHQSDGDDIVTISSDHVWIQDCVATNWNYDNMIQDGGIKNIYLDVDSGYSEDQIVSEVSAVDLFGVDVAVSVKSSDYVIGKTGIFNIVLEATDKYGQTATATLIVNVLDYSDPIITLITNPRYTYGTVLTEEELLKNFSFTDNMGVSGLTYQFTYPTGFDISKPLVFGNYSLMVKATDAFGNSSTLSFTLNVIDTTAPIISKKDGAMSDKIGIAYSSISNNTIGNILQLFKAVDAVDGNCDVYLKSGSIPSGMAGDFTLTIAAKDKSNNEAISTINLEIIADLPPVFILSDKLVSCTSDNPLVLEDLVKLVRNGILRGINADNISVNASGYLSNSTVQGTYPVSYSYTDVETMEPASGTFMLQVNTPADSTDKVKEDNFFVKAFKTVFTDIKHATGIDWFIVIATILVPLLLIGFLLSKSRRR